MSVVLRRREQGDTIIEVMFAVAVFAMIAVGSLAIMNQGTATAQRSLEVTLVRQQIQAQAEALRFVHAAYVANYQAGAPPSAGAAAEWAKITSSYGAEKASNFGVTGSTTCPEAVPGELPFIMNARTAKVQAGIVQMSPPEGASLPPFAQVIYNETTPSVIDRAYGLWIEAVPASPPDGTAYVDFHIRACWNSPGIDRPLTLGTIVRLYDPSA
jgi:type II secretory pathway pseudopilin PulG